MNDSEDTGLSIGTLWTVSWVLSIVAVACLVRVISYPHGVGQGVALRGLFAWAIAGCMAAVFAAASAVLVGLKTAEQRAVQRSARRAADSP